MSIIPLTNSGTSLQIIVANTEVAIDVNIETWDNSMQPFIELNQKLESELAAALKENEELETAQELEKKPFDDKVKTLTAKVSEQAAQLQTLSATFGAVQPQVMHWRNLDIQIKEAMRSF